uniref:Histone RNA hairpin-binding protein RNA-binding domain-containing protein n=1 Tax=Globodera rostochiensis TaxID=31243 RepID=A0A914GRG7_GLORO
MLQNALRTKLAELQNSRRAEEEKEQQPQKLDLSLFDTSDLFNRSWVEMIDEEEEQRKKAAAASSSVSSDKFLLKVEQVDSSPNLKENAAAAIGSQSAGGSTPSSKLLPKPREGWSEPRTGWCNDIVTLERRDKDLHKMKEKPTYKRYLSQIPKFSRKKNVHPRTPNKYTNHTRRSWDKQVRLWKLAIYEWAGETPSPSVFGSRCPSVCSGEESPSLVKTPSGGTNSSLSSSAGPATPKRMKMAVPTTGVKEEEKHSQKRGETNAKSSPPPNKKSRSYNDINIAIANPDNMASMLGHFDMDTLRGGESTLMGGEGDESTLKAITAGARAVQGPTDFSYLVPKKDIEVAPPKGEKVLRKEVDAAPKGRKVPKQEVKVVPGKVEASPKGKKVPKKAVEEDENDGWVEVKKRPRLVAKKRTLSKK